MKKTSRSRYLCTALRTSSPYQNSTARNTAIISQKSVFTDTMYVLISETMLYAAMTPPSVQSLGDIQLAYPCRSLQESGSVSLRIRNVRMIFPSRFSTQALYMA